jgi:hypothetical protein
VDVPRGRVPQGCGTIVSVDVQPEEQAQKYEVLPHGMQ